MIVKQFEVGNYMVFGYLIGDEETGEALVIDPADEAQQLIAFAELHGVKITSILNTHAHIDHIMGNAQMVRLTGAKIIIHEAESYSLNHPSSGSLSLSGRAFPPSGHPRKGWGYHSGRWAGYEGDPHLLLDDMVFTGDTLFVGGVGRTDLPGGSWEILESSIRHRLFTLPDDTAVLPGHNYGLVPTSTIRIEKLTNPSLRL
jgi:glyoxylase-like metal-dependent hydrolase (beta-lactamase superfamily II)